MRVGVGAKIPLEFSSLPLLLTLFKDPQNRFYFESDLENSEEKFSSQLLDHELGEGSVERLLSSASSELLKKHLEELRLSSPLPAVASVHRDVLSFHEKDLSERVHPCLVRFPGVSPEELCAEIEKAKTSLCLLGVDPSLVTVSSVLAEW